MKIAYVTTYDSSDIQAWSGAGNQIALALQQQGLALERIGNLDDGFRLLSKGKKFLYTKLLARSYLRDREPLSLRSFATQVERRLAHSDCDVVFSPGTVPIAYLNTDKPIVFWSDATFAGMLDFYGAFSNLCAETVRNGHRMEQLALSRCRLAIYSSEWAAKTAIQHYDVDPAKVKVVPFGANIVCERTSDDIRVIAVTKDRATCRLLFIGVDWLRKGGDIALEVTERLIRMGIDAELHVVGCTPPDPVPEYVKVYGYLSKKNAADRDLLTRLFLDSHFFIMPSRAECYGLVYAEASSFGLPSLATRIGGIPSVVRDGHNGKTFRLDADPEDYCDYIAAVMASPADYTRAAVASFEQYQQHFNWSVAGARVAELLRGIGTQPAMAPAFAPEKVLIPGLGDAAATVAEG